MARPFTNKVEKGWKKRTDPMVGGARSITLYDARAHPRLGGENLFPRARLNVCHYKY